MGKSEWQSYSQGWQSYNKPHCLSVGRLLFAIFLYRPHKEKKKQPLLAVSLSSRWHFLSICRFSGSLHPRFSNSPFLLVLFLLSFGWLSLAMAHCSSWQWPPPFLPLTHKSLPFPLSNFQMNFIRMKCSEVHSPSSSPPLCVSVWLHKALLARFNDNNSSAFSSPYFFVSLSLSVQIGLSLYATINRINYVLPWWEYLLLFYCTISLSVRRVNVLLPFHLYLVNIS